MKTKYDHILGRLRTRDGQDASGTTTTSDTPVLIPITYQALRTLRDSNSLHIGQCYRITDYVTTVANDPEACSAGHPFDIVVVATSPNTLSEEARAMLTSKQYETSPDGISPILPFSDCRIDLWKIWYCLDNDTARFEWADEVNGKGVIYRMIDEWGHDCPYDFKNILFKRYRVRHFLADGTPGNLDGKYVGVNEEMYRLHIPDKEDFELYPTFAVIDKYGTKKKIYDATNYRRELLRGHGVIKPTRVGAFGLVQSFYRLNNVVYLAPEPMEFLTYYDVEVEEDSCMMTLTGDIHVGKVCSRIIMGEECAGKNTINPHHDVIGDHCEAITLVDCKGFLISRDVSECAFHKPCTCIRIMGMCGEIDCFNPCDNMTIQPYTYGIHIQNENMDFVISNTYIFGLQKQGELQQIVAIENTGGMHSTFVAHKSDGSIRIWNPAEIQ